MDIPGDLVYEFLHLTQVDALQLVGDYKVHLLHERKLTEATVNRRLAAVKALVAQGRKAGMCGVSEKMRGKREGISCRVSYDNKSPPLDTKRGNHSGVLVSGKNTTTIAPSHAFFRSPNRRL